MTCRRWSLAFAVVICFVPGLAHAQGDRLTPLVVGWERFFTISSETVRSAGATRVAGYLTNEAGFKAQRVRLLIDGLDASGQVAGQSIAFVPSPGPGPSGRVYFDEPAPAGVGHRVSVFAYDWLQSAMFDAP